MKIHTAPAFCALALMLCAAGPVAAQPDLPPPPRGRGGRETIDPRLRQRVESLMTWRLTEELGLSAEQSDRFFPLWRKSRSLRDDYRTSRRQVVQSLEQALQANSIDLPRLKLLMDSLNTLEDSYRSAERRTRREMNELLSVEQQARLMVFTASFEREMRRLIDQIRREQQPGRGSRK